MTSNPTVLTIVSRLQPEQALYRSVIDRPLRTPFDVGEDDWQGTLSDPSTAS